MDTIGHKTLGDVEKRTIHLEQEIRWLKDRIIELEKKNRLLEMDLKGMGRSLVRRSR